MCSTHVPGGAIPRRTLSRKRCPSWFYWEWLAPRGLGILILVKFQLTLQAEIDGTGGVEADRRNDPGGLEKKMPILAFKETEQNGRLRRQDSLPRRRPDSLAVSVWPTVTWAPNAKPARATAWILLLPRCVGTGPAAFHAAAAPRNTNGW